MDNQIHLENQFESALSHFKGRVKNSGLIIWFYLFRKKLVEFRKARKERAAKIYGEFMQIETLAKECEPSEASAKLIKKIQKLKSVIGVLCLGVLCLATMKFSVVRSHARVNQARVVRVAKRRKEGENA